MKDWDGFQGAYTVGSEFFSPAVPLGRSVAFRAASLIVAVAAAGAGVAPFVASADPAPSWDGWYKVTFQTDRKSGTSMAAGQSETPTPRGISSPPTALREPALPRWSTAHPKDNAAQATKFEWTGSQWSRTNNWRWDCGLGDGTLTFDPASSVTTYSPQPDGSLTGTFATNIGSGACQGTVHSTGRRSG